MTSKHAHRRYMKLFIPAMVLYVVSITGVALARAFNILPEPVLYAVSTIPAIFMIIWILGHMRYIYELDEFMQKLQVKAILLGLAGIMIIATIWGLMEVLASAPALPVFYVVPGFYFIYGLAYIIIAKRAGVKGWGAYL
ncbi:MAG: hypothetical protein JKY25_11835 [Robiginitomaculum sp.]|nr:hypothetical protein [Robiginitomaculum sp.]